MIKNSFLYLACLFLFASCSERIDISTQDAPPAIVIYGKLTTELKHQSISITRSAGFFANTKPEGVSDALVWVRTDDHEFQLVEKDDQLGVYESLVPEAGVEGKTYSLRIDVDFDGDGRVETYEASSFLYPHVKLDTVLVRPFKEKERFVEVCLSADLPDIVNNIANYYSFHVYRNDVIVNDSLQNFLVFDDEYLGVQNLREFPFYYLDQEDELEKVSQGDKVSVRVDVITKEYADFITRAQVESGASIPMFSGPPANVPSNISCSDPSILVFGFFTAYSFDTNWTVMEVH